jgi:hypothetical protein
MMRQCWEWMMSLGWAGTLLGVLLTVALVALIVTLIGRAWRGSPK